LETILKHCVEEDEKEKIQKRYTQLYGYTEYEPNELEKEVIEVIYKSFNDNEEIKLRPPEIREEIQNENLWGFWKDRDLTPHQKDIAIGFIIKKFNLSSEKKNTNKGVVYLFEREKVSKIRNLYCKSEENTPDSPLLSKNNESSVKNGEELWNPNSSL
jgi:hypothetical protein